MKCLQCCTKKKKKKMKNIQGYNTYIQYPLKEHFICTSKLVFHNLTCCFCFLFFKNFLFIYLFIFSLPSFPTLCHHVCGYLVGHGNQKTTPKTLLDGGGEKKEIVNLYVLKGMFLVFVTFYKQDK